jgi:hypothetical protein
VRLRLLIPAALAAAVTYAALVRDEPAAATQWTPYAPVPEPPAPSPPTPTPEEPLAAVLSIVPVLDASEPEDHEVAPVAWADSPFADLAAAAAETQPTSVYDMLAGSPPVEAPDEVSPVGETRQADPQDGVAPLDEGRFALGGWAAAPGHSAVSAITFRRRLPADVTIEQIVLEIEVSENVADDGLVILADPGFAPDRDGCALRLSAADAGQFSVAGSYRVLPA